jgi:hypothetical protein
VTVGQVKEITSKGTAVQGTFTQKESYAGSKPSTLFRTEIPAFADNNALSRLLQQKRVTVNAQPLDTGASWWQNLLLGFGPTILFVLLLFWLMRRAGNVQNVLGSFGRSRARRYQPSGDRVTFADVAGIDEAKAELTEVVDFLRHPDKYQKLGGRIPHGVLLSGAPGTGKTLLARAVAGEADVPFFSMAASEFVEAIVGVGVSRVRDLFTQAKEAAPAIVFIDELDAIGRSRTSGVAGFSGGNDEREQTLNQILTEMDGFDSANQGQCAAAVQGQVLARWAAGPRSSPSACAVRAEPSRSRRRSCGRYSPRGRPVDQLDGQMPRRPAGVDHADAVTGPQCGQPVTGYRHPGHAGHLYLGTSCPDRAGEHHRCRHPGNPSVLLDVSCRCGSFLPAAHRSDRG